MPRFPETELILTPDKRVYHLNLKAEDIADTVVVVGDQNRVREISKHFNHIEFKTAHREFITHTGIYKGKRITVLSTGIGTDNIDIVMNELDAAVNINPETRELNPKLRSLNIFRLGTSGSIRKEIPVDSILVSSHGLGLDGLLPYYIDRKYNLNELCDTFLKHPEWNGRLPKPYCYEADADLLDRFSKEAYSGITATAPGFYGPQGRRLRLEPSVKDLHEVLRTFNYRNLQITNFEMETSALYGLGKLLGHRCLTLCVIIANRETLEFTNNYTKSIDKLVEFWLDKI
ncbi:MAG: nucleoside phosphorylase [Bacteroidia bacterium]|nr:nucleoside phosphorylase [Bacteroidia bacterium]